MKHGIALAMAVAAVLSARRPAHENQRRMVTTPALSANDAHADGVLDFAAVAHGDYTKPDEAGGAPKGGRPRHGVRNRQGHPSQRSRLRRHGEPWPVTCCSAARCTLHSHVVQQVCRLLRTEVLLITGRGSPFCSCQNVRFMDNLASCCLA